MRDTHDLLNEMDDLAYQSSEAKRAWVDLLTPDEIEKIHDELTKIYVLTRSLSAWIAWAIGKEQE